MLLLLSLSWLLSPAPDGKINYCSNSICFDARICVCLYSSTCCLPKCDVIQFHSGRNFSFNLFIAAICQSPWPLFFKWIKASFLLIIMWIILYTVKTGFLAIVLWLKADYLTGRIYRITCFGTFCVCNFNEPTNFQISQRNCW